MLQLRNKTPFAVDSALLLDLDGSEIWVVVVKATFQLVNGIPTLADKQEPVCQVDKYYGEPGTSSLHYEGELTFRKPGTDFVVNCHAYAPGEQKASRVDVHIEVHGRTIALRVFGDRYWKRGVTGPMISEPEPFWRIPLVYERAFGGVDQTSDDPREHGAEFRNPIGRGFAMTRSAVYGRTLPNIEDPFDEITGWQSRPAPVGTGFILKHWEPRRSYAGTFDQHYIDTRLPLYPLDFNPRFFQGAHPNLIFLPHLRGGEAVRFTNLTPAGDLAFELPRVHLGFRTNLGGKWIDHSALLATVLLEPDELRVVMTWQTFLRCHRKRFDLTNTEIYQKKVLSTVAV